MAKKFFQCSTYRLSLLSFLLFFSCQRNGTDFYGKKNFPPPVPNYQRNYQQNYQQNYNPYYQPNSRAYSNPYNPPQSYYQYYDSDHYYVPPAYFKNVEPAETRSNSGVELYR